MIRCPVCGMEIAEGLAKRVMYNGQLYLVASDRCTERFLADPIRYTAADTRSHSHNHPRTHGCC